MLRAFLFTCFLVKTFASDPIVITPVQPDAGGAYGQLALRPELIITSEFELKSVTASFNNRVIPLTFINGRWSSLGALDFTGVPSGTTRVLFKATDAFDRSAELSAPFLLDRPPVLHVSTPDVAVARPLIEFHATCEDDLGGCTIDLLDDRETLLLTGTGRIDGIVDFSADEGTIRSVRFVATDNVRNRTTEPREIISLSNPHFQTMSTVNGTIQDATSDAILFSDRSRGPVVLLRLDRRSGAVQAIRANVGLYPKPALTATGALFMFRSPQGSRLYDWNRGDYIDLTEELSLDPDFQLAMTKGRFGLLSDPAIAALVVLRDFVARTNIIFPIVSSWSHLTENGLAVIGGDKLYQLGGNALRTISARANISYKMPHTDGTNSVWFEYNPLQDLGEIWAETKQGIVQLGSGYNNRDLTYNYDNYDVRPYLVENGWIAYPRSGAQGQRQVWLRSPEGAESQLTFFSQPSFLRALRSDGAAVVSVPDIFGTLYFVRPGRLPVMIGPAFSGSYYFEGDKLQGIIADTMFEINVNDSPIRLSSPQVNAAANTISFFVTATAAKTFQIERSTNLIDWSVISTNSVSNSLPQKFQVPLPPRRLNGINSLSYRARVQ